MVASFIFTGLYVASIVACYLVRERRVVTEEDIDCILEEVVIVSRRWDDSCEKRHGHVRH